MGRPPMGCAPAVFGRFLKPGGLGGRPRFALALPTMPLVREKARSSSSNFCDDESWGFWDLRRKRIVPIDTDRR